jgi:predicted porin
MQKKIVALAVAGLSTAAFAQTNVTIYGVADVSGQGFAMNKSKAGDYSSTSGQAASGNTFNLQSNSSLIGFKGTEDLGNGLKALFQAETTLALTGGSAVAYGTSNNAFGAMRDSFVGLNSKYGTAMAGYLSTPLRATLVSFDVMPGATGSSQIDKIFGTVRFGERSLNGGNNSTAGQEYAASIRATAIAYAMPTMYGFDASIAYTGSNNNGRGNGTDSTGCSAGGSVSACSIAPQSAFGLNLGWTGYGVSIKGAFQQQGYNTINDDVNATAYTSYLVGASYTGIQNLKASVAYARNTLGVSGNSAVAADGAGKISNNQLYTGASYRMGNWEPRVSAVWSSDLNGTDAQQNGARQWTANVGYYLSKRTQVYGLVSNLNNSANQNYSFGQQSNNLKPTGGQNMFTYGMGMRTTF